MDLVAIKAGLMCSLVQLAFTQCPASSTPSPQENGCNSVDGGNTTICGKVQTINRPLSQMFVEQPLYLVIYPNLPSFTVIDNECITLFPIPDGCNTYRAYISTTYIDGSTSISSLITKTVGTGANLWASPARGYTNYNLGDIGCGAYLRQSCGLNAFQAPTILIAFGPGLGNGSRQLTDECLETARNLAKENGLDLGDVYLPPYKLPTNCVLEQICLPNNTSLSCQEGSSCKAYDTSSCYA